MSAAAHRSLARLPLEIFENLVVVSNNNNDTLVMLEEAEEEDNDDDNEDNEEYNAYNGGHNNASVDPQQPELLAHDAVDAAMLREAICQKLKAIPPSKQMPHRRKSLRLAAAAAANAAAAATGNGNTTTTSNSSNTINNATLLDSIQTVGPLLFMSKPALVRALDPLLTFAECTELIRRICLYCSPTPKSAMELLHMTRDALDSTGNSNAVPNSRLQEQMENAPSALLQQACCIRRHIPTGLTSLDCQLRGGVRVGTLTEIVGMTATAKSQLAMQLCIMASAGMGHQQQQQQDRGGGGGGGGAVYIDAENKMSLQRLEEMAMSASRYHVQQQRRHRLLVALQSLSPRPLNNMRYLNSGNQYQLEDEEEAFRHCRDFLANVSVHTPTTMDELFATLALVEDDIYLRNEQAQQQQALLFRQQQQQPHHAASTLRGVGNNAGTSAIATTARFPVRLLILDSIAAPARREFGSGSAPQRAAAVMQCAQTLKRLADELQLAVVVLNQVDHHSTSSSLQQQQHHRAALGTAWHHCVSTRIHLSSLPPRPPTTGVSDIHGGNNRSSMIAASSSSSSLFTQQQEQITRIPRMASIVKSNVTGQGPPVSFEVTTSGLVEMQPGTITSISSQHNNYNM